MKRKKIIAYDHSLVAKARELRNKPTYSEFVLWRHLKKKQVLGYDFDRQKPIAHYIVDFFCNELMLAIEVDGISHLDKEEYDKKRQGELEKLGISFLRFNALDVVHNTEGVMDVITQWVEAHRQD